LWPPPPRAMSSPRRKRERGAESADELDVSALRTFLRKEESDIRVAVNELVNRDLMERINATKALEAKVGAEVSYTAALETGLVQEVRTEMRACFSVGVRLEAWVNTFAPPLSAGGNVGVSAEVQEGIFSIIHALTAGCGEAMQRMLAYEKEHAVMRTKCSDETIWLRYKSALESAQLHDLRKATIQMYGDLLMISNSICSNLSHLRADLKEEMKLSSMY